MPDISTLNGVDVGDVASMNGSDAGDCASVNGQVWPNLAGTLWVWGDGRTGNMGIGAGANNDVSSPIQVGTDTDWSISSLNTDGSNVLCIKTDGTIWSWGGGAHGRHGLAAITSDYNVSSPIQMGTSTNWTAAGAGSNAQGIIGGGKLYTFGYNAAGALGHNLGLYLANGNRVASRGTQSSPTQVGTDTNWSKITGGTHSFIALKTDGTLWGWGSNQNGTSGINVAGNNGARSSPVQVGTATNWTQISAHAESSGAINADGELYMWGRGGYTGNGQGDNVDRSVPIQVGTDTDWAALSINYGNALALKTDGSIYIWGLGRYGQLGNNTTGNTAHVSSPIQVGTTTNNASIFMGRSFAKVRKTDGTMFSWGKNTKGELGRGDEVNRSTPTQMGTDANWGQASAGVGFSSGGGNNAEIKT